MSEIRHSSIYIMDLNPNFLIIHFCAVVIGMNETLSHLVVYNNLIEHKRIFPLQIK